MPTGCPFSYTVTVALAVAGPFSVGVVSSVPHQVFGHWHGRVTAGGEDLVVDGVLGFAEDVRTRW